MALAGELHRTRRAPCDPDGWRVRTPLDQETIALSCRQPAGGAAPELVGQQALSAKAVSACSFMHICVVCLLHAQLPSCRCDPRALITNPHTPTHT